MQISNNTAVSIHYTLTNEAGEIIDSSVESGEPLVYLHGQGNIISGLEHSLHGRQVGDKFNIEVGMQFHADVSEGPGIVTVVAVDGDNVTIDGNHPLAGMPLTFEIEVIDIRAASEEEIEHGHIHGAGGHHH
jgi:FKBP-type peptidyl-prolyl cis-trans isomerase SlyD